MIGAKKEDNKYVCKKCGKQLNMFVPDLFNYCPFCGNPLNIATANLVIEKQKGIKLKTLHQVQGIIKNKDELLEFAKIAKEIMQK